MKFTKIYVEITNICNLNCSFCSKDNRPKEEMSLENFELILKKIKNYTKSIYLHVKGEPLLYSKLDDLLTLCDQYNMKVKITTNGTLLKDKYQILNAHPSLKQVNVSLHSENNTKNYFEEVFDASNRLKNIPIIYRIWLLDDYKLDVLSTRIVDKIIDYYKLDNSFKEKILKDKNIKIRDNLYLDKDNYFKWPNETKTSNNKTGTCFGTRSHIAILVNGDVVPCCLDSKGVLKLGNIFKDDMIDILNNQLFKDINNGFKNHKVIASLCQNCEFKNKFH